MFPEVFMGGFVLFAGGVFSIRVAEGGRATPTGEGVVGRELAPGLDRVSLEGAGIAALGLVMMLASTAL
jgi:hypothetical protein